MHSSGMRTARLLTVSQHALGGGCVSQHALGVCIPIPACTGQGVSAQGVSAQRCLPLVLGGGRHPPPVDRETPVKT